MNRNLLEAKLKEKGTNVAEISKFLGIDKVTFYRKLSGESDFYKNEISKICQFLELTVIDMERIFFSELVAFT